jgi:DNA invertase Pin-like site-specific DNA recombinase
LVRAAGIFSALAEFERYVIRERTMAGLKAASARRCLGGRPEKLSAKDKQHIRVVELAGEPGILI